MPKSFPCSPNSSSPLAASPLGIAITGRPRPEKRAGEEHGRRTLLAPYRTKKRDTAPEKSAILSRLRYRIDNFFSQLTGRNSVTRVWAKDLWHLASRLLRKVLSHTVAFLLNHRAGNRPLQLAKLLH
jgi:hypothetical protein